MPIEEPYMSTPSGAGDTSAAASDPGAKAQELAGEAMDKARNVARSQLDTGKSRAAENISGVAESLRQAGRSLDQNSELPVGQYMHQAAAQMERLAQTLSEKEPEELLLEAERFARRQPAVFLGLAFAGGLMAARFLKSSGSGATIKDRAMNTYHSATGTRADMGGSGTYSGEARVAEPVSERPAGSW